MAVRWGLAMARQKTSCRETFLALMQKPQIPVNAEHYCVRSFRNRALNHQRSAVATPDARTGIAALV